MKIQFAMVAGVVAAVCFTSLPAGAATETFDVANDFSTTQNPNGA
jgi:hypothetical protein